MKLPRPRTLTVLVAGLVFVSGLFLGWHFAWRLMEMGSGSHYPLQGEAGTVRRELAAAQEALAVAQARSEVDREALEMVRRDMVTQEEQIAELREGLRFYQSVMAPDAGPEGLSVREPELVVGDVPGRFSLRVVVQQKAEKHAQVLGSLAIKINGLQGQEKASFPLEYLADGLDPASLALEFRYFQAVSVDLVLPDDFQPTDLSVAVSTTKPQKSRISQQFPWRVQERFTHVGK